MPFPHAFAARLLGAVALAALLTTPIARAEDSDPVLARANGVDIRQSDLTLAEEDIGSAMPQMGPEQKRDYLITYLADVIILAQAADQHQRSSGDPSPSCLPVHCLPSKLECPCICTHANSQEKRTTNLWEQPDEFVRLCLDVAAAADGSAPGDVHDSLSRARA